MIIYEVALCGIYKMNPSFALKRAQIKAELFCVHFLSSLNLITLVILRGKMMKSAIIFKNITLEVNLFATSENSCTKFSTHQVPDRDRIECSHTEKKTPK